MSDQRIQATENMIGANHPTLSDTLNRLTLVEHNTDGTHNAITTAGTIVQTLATDSSSSTTGAIKTAGGMGIAKKLYVGTDLNVGGGLSVAGSASTGALTATGVVASNPIATPTAVGAVATGTTSSAQIQVGLNSSAIGARLLLNNAEASGKRWDLNNGGLITGALTIYNNTDDLKVMTFLSSGNVLIGTTTDNGSGAELQVNGALTATRITSGTHTGVTVDNTDYTAGNLSLIKIRQQAGVGTGYSAYLGQTVDGKLWLANDTITTNHFCINTTGNVLIGSSVASTGAKLEVTGSISATTSISSDYINIGSGAYSGQLSYSAAKGVFVGATSNHKTSIISNNATIAEFSSTGLSVTGSISSTSTISINNGSGLITRNTDASTYSIMNNDGATGVATLRIGNNSGTEYAKFSSTGLSVTGNLSCTGSLTINPSTATSATAGGGSALPATPSGYFSITLNATTYKVPFYPV